MQTSTPQAALARLEHAMGELCGARDRLAEGLEEALGALGNTMAGLELALRQPGAIQDRLGAPTQD